MPDADDEFAGGAVVLHVVVGLRHLLHAVIDTVHGEGQPAGAIASRISWKTWLTAHAVLKYEPECPFGAAAAIVKCPCAGGLDR
ncbi:MAG TPA: hypothetical protein VGG50_18075 [Streptosporangiaceae bacterium]|jgi:hypothetical protein